MNVEVVTAVKVRIFAGPSTCVEIYRMDNADERAAWNANAKAYPTTIIEQIKAEMSEDDARAFALKCEAARDVAHAMKLNLRTNAP